MAAAYAPLVTRHRATLAQLNHAYATGDESAFERALGELNANRQSPLLTDVQRLTESLLGALTRFRADSRLAALAVREVPDARLRLDHVLAMTEEAAHRTLDLVEQSAPLADATVRRAAELADTLDERSHREIRDFLGEVRGNAEQVRHNLTEVMLAQGVQDLTGQILHGVRTLVGEIETILQQLASIAGVTLQLPALEEGADIPQQDPAIPGLGRNMVTAQGDVDDLIASHGVLPAPPA
jgi:chemotaxis protein CheZ